MLNNVIIIITLLALVILLAVRKTRAFTVLAIVAYCCLPVLRLGADFSNAISSAYPLSVVVAAGALVYRFALVKKFTKLQWLYGFFTILVIGLTCVGWLFGRIFDMSGLVTLISTAVNGVGVIALSYFISVEQPEKRRNTMLLGVGITAAINLVFSLIQYFNFDIGYKLTYAFYATPSRTGPLRTAAVDGIFYRAYGATYSPLLSGVLLLVCVAFVLGMLVMSKKKSTAVGVALFAVTLSGLLILSKAFILGSIAVTGLAVVISLFLIKDKKEKLKKSLICVLAISLAFVCVKVVTLDTRIAGFVNYYYGYITNPFNALLSRYSGIVEPHTQSEEPTTDSGDTEQPTNPDGSEQTTEPADENTPDDGIALPAMTIFKEYPIFGVGPVKISGEFIGDSMFVYVLHNGGLALAGAYAAFFGWLAIMMLRRRRYDSLIIIGACFLSCFAAVTFIYFCMVPFVAYLVAERDIFDRKKRAAKQNCSQVISVCPADGSILPSDAFAHTDMKVTEVALYTAPENNGAKPDLCLNQKFGSKLGTARKLVLLLIKENPAAVIVTGDTAALATLAAIIAGTELIAYYAGSAHPQASRAMRFILKYSSISVLSDDKNAADDLCLKLKLNRAKLLTDIESNNQSEPTL